MVVGNAHPTLFIGKYKNIKKLKMVVVNRLLSRVGNAHIVYQQIEKN
jgi:hypothetical protein